MNTFSCTVFCDLQTDGDKVIGGSTFRLFRSGQDALVLDVLTLAVRQEPKICGRGYGTMMVNVLKALVLQEAREMVQQRSIIGHVSRGVANCHCVQFLLHR
eukprot:COSAG02_NODE_525_length_20713_cov_5.808286_18_plen_101_part_00